MYNTVRGTSTSALCLRPPLRAAGLTLVYCESLTSYTPHPLRANREGASSIVTAGSQLTPHLENRGLLCSHSQGESIGAESGYSPETPPPRYIIQSGALARAPSVSVHPSVRLRFLTPLYDPAPTPGIIADRCPSTRKRAPIFTST